MWTLPLSTRSESGTIVIHGTPSLESVKQSLAGIFDASKAASTMQRIQRFGQCSAYWPQVLA